MKARMWAIAAIFALGPLDAGAQVIDRFETYPDTAALLLAWPDSSNHGTVNKTLDTAVRKSGIASMKIEFPAQAEHSVGVERALSPALDLSTSTKAWVWVRGDAGNDQDDQLTMFFTDSTGDHEVLLWDSGVGSAINPTHNNWVLAEADLSGLGNPAQVQAIGVGVTQADGSIGAGTYWFDDLTGDRPIPPYGIERFETYADTAALETAWSDQFGTSPTQTLSTTVANSPTQSLRLEYTGPPGSGRQSVWRLFNPPLDLGGSNKLYIWVLGAAGNNPDDFLTLAVSTASGYGHHPLRYPGTSTALPSTVTTWTLAEADLRIPARFGLTRPDLFVQATAENRYPLIEGIGIEVLEWSIGDPPVFSGTGPSVVFFDDLSSDGSVPVELLSFVVQ